MSPWKAPVLLLASLLAAVPVLHAGLPSLPSESEPPPSDSSKVVETKTALAFDKVYPGEEFQAVLTLTIKEGWHVNPPKPTLDYLFPTSIQATVPQGIALGEWRFPPTGKVKFAFEDQPLDVYEGKVVIRTTLKTEEPLAAGIHTVGLTIKLQACDNNVCLRPGTIELPWPIQVVDAGTPRTPGDPALFAAAPAGQVVTPPVPPPATEPEAPGFLARALGQGYFFRFLAFFVVGFLLILTPCVYPMVPITIGYFGGQGHGSRWRTLGLALLYVLGMALTYSVLGTIAALSGGMLGALLQKPLVNLLLAGVMVLLALSQFGLYEFRLPGASGGMVRARGGSFGAFFMGLLLGLVAAPCLGPFLIAVLTHVAKVGSGAYGFAVFFVMSLGLGLPFVVLALASGSIQHLPRSGEWMEWVKHLFGVILLGMAVYFLRFLPWFPDAGRKWIYLVLAFLAALYLGFLTRSGNASGRFRAFKAIFAVLVFAGAASWLLLAGEARGPVWAPYSEDALRGAVKAGRPVAIDFTAEWCIPCKEMEATTFRDPRVVEVLRRFVLLRADMTSETRETKALADRWDIPGVPQILLLDKEGKEVLEARVRSFVEADAFLEKLKQVPQ